MAPTIPKKGVSAEIAEYPELVARKAAIEARLSEISVPAVSSTTAVVKAPRRRGGSKAPRPETPSSSLTTVVKKTDTHFDFLLKEMQWLAADFTAERKRHRTASRKLAHGVHAHFSQREKRRVRDLTAAVARQRKVAAKLARETVAWWTKLNRVLAHQQKMDMERARRQAMNHQLVQLVHQTEAYSQSLARQPDDSSLTIEQALAAGTRRSKQRVTDYARLERVHRPAVLYGELTEESAESADDSYADHHHDAKDDETTLVQAEVEEIRERRRILAGVDEEDDDEEDDDDDAVSFVADPEELRKLQEEGDMDLDLVLERLRAEGGSSVSNVERHVSFASQQDLDEEAPHRKHSAVADPGNDADDDADASDVEDFVLMADNAEGDDDGSDDFIVDEAEVDDETTIAQEERLPREMSEAEEIKLLEDESELPIEELRRRYAAVLAPPADDEEDESDMNAADEIPEDGDEEFRPVSGADVDDETTIKAEERLGRDMTYEEEVALLENEGNIPIERLRQMYSGMNDDTDDIDDDMVEEEGDQSEILGAAQLLSQDDNDASEQEDYQPKAGETVDDETTIAAEEQRGRDMTYEEEISVLQQESEMPIHELRAMYSQMEREAETEEAEKQSSFASELDKAIENEENDEEFRLQGEEVDDETTIEQEERLGREMSAESEIAMLKAESELPVDELRAMYKETDDHNKSTNPSKRKRESPATDRRNKNRRLESESSSEDSGRVALDALEASAERARKTLASRPFLLAPWVKLRQYQQTGLNWLVSLQSRRLNGILADGTTRAVYIVLTVAQGG